MLLRKVGDEMNKWRKHTEKKNLGNQGFSLIELLISIAILVLLMIPLMNNFIRSMQMNEKADDIQKQSNLAANIMEGLKNLNMSETIYQFTTGKTSFNVITDEAGNPIVEENAIKVLEYDASTNLYSEVNPADYSNIEGQAIYYFAIHGIPVDGTAYDALIKMNSNTYRPEGSATLNKYPMPDAIKLDEMVNGLLFSKGQADTDTMDNNALNTYLQWGKAYALELFYQSSEYLDYQANYLGWVNEYEEAQMQGKPEADLPSPPSKPTFNEADYQDYCDLGRVNSKITKTMKITVSQEGEKASNPLNKNMVEYQINYKCNWPSGSTLESAQEYQVSVKDYEIPIENIYLFYKPSTFANFNFDVVEINNITPLYTINFYAADQVQVDAIIPITPKLIISTHLDDKVSVYTNIDKTSMNVKLLVDGNDKTIDLNQGIVKAEEKVRLYEATVQIFEYVNTTNIANKYKEQIYTLTSTREK
jgi:prepilin-type N-terminal cleavage/methylation domain-containing protein